MAKKGTTPWNKGLRGIQPGPKPWIKLLVGEASPVWKGDKAGYRAIHYWVSYHFGKAAQCEECGKRGIGHEIHWANISGLYKRERSDWKQLCGKHHKLFDVSKKINV